MPSHFSQNLADIGIAKSKSTKCSRWPDGTPFISNGLELKEEIYVQGLCKENVEWHSWFFYARLKCLSTSTEFVKESMMPCLVYSDGRVCQQWEVLMNKTLNLISWQCWHAVIFIKRNTIFLVLIQNSLVLTHIVSHTTCNAKWWPQLRLSHLFHNSEASHPGQQFPIQTTRSSC